MARRLTALDRLKQRILEQEAGQHPRLKWESNPETAMPTGTVKCHRGTGGRDQEGNAWSVDRGRRAFSILVKHGRVPAIAGGREGAAARVQRWQAMIELEAAGLE